MMENYSYSKVNILTGSIGSGKSSVSAILRDLGAEVVCADQLARKAVAPGSIGLQRIEEAFGSSILVDGSLDRSKLSEIIFKNPNSRKRLESITHPIIRGLSLEAFETALLENPSVPIFYDCPLFFESGLAENNFASVVVVSASRETCIDRIVKRDNISKERAIARIESQLPISKKVDAADYVIENEHGLTQLRSKVEKLYETISKLPIQQSR